MPGPPKLVAIGSVSTGTHSPMILKDAFETELEYYDSHGFTTSREEYTQNCVDDLFDRLAEIAPDYCSFGAHPNDGADFGFWPDWEAIDDGIHDKEILRVDDSSEDDKKSTYLLVVNDHGNHTLYGPHDEKTDSRTEIWSIV